MSYVYIFTNEAMPGYVKIGMTDLPISERLLSMDNTSTPLPFLCYYAARVSDNRKVERALHTAFGDSRVRASREFFMVSPHRVRAVLEVIAEEDVTPREEIVASQEDAEALRNVSKKSRRFSFTSAGIPIGAKLELNRGQDISCLVTSDTSVIYENEEMSVSKAALLALRKLGYNWPTVAGTEHWLYQGETLLSHRDAQER
jgi:hypothetical protein